MSWSSESTARYRKSPKGQEAVRRSYEARKKRLQTVEGKAFIRERNLRRQYGISVEEYDAMMAHQGGLCAIC